MATNSHLAQESVWTDKSKFEDAEAQLHAQLAKSLEQPVAVAEVQQQPLPVSNQNDQGPVEAQTQNQTQPDAAARPEEPVTQQDPPAQEQPQPLITEAPALSPTPEKSEAVVAVAEKPAEECPYLKKKDDTEEQQPSADTNVKEKKQKKAKTSTTKEPVPEESPQPQEQTAPKDPKDAKDAQQQQASAKAEKKQKEKQAPKEKQPPSEKGGKQKKQAKDKQDKKEDITADNTVQSLAAVEPLPEAQSDSRKKGSKKKDEKQDGGGEEKKLSGQKGGVAKKGKQHVDKVVESAPLQAQDSSKAVKEEKAEKVDTLPKSAKEQSPEFAGRLGKLEAENAKLNKVIENLQGQIQKLEVRVSILEAGGLKSEPTNQTKIKTEIKSEEEEDVDLFGASDEDSAEKERLHQERVKAYTEKKSKKPALIAKSSVILDVKPWDDETDMKEMERLVREIQMDGLVWGASKLVPLAFGIHKLQIGCVVEDEKVSIDLLQEQIQEIEQFVQSADVAAFNKV